MEVQLTEAELALHERVQAVIQGNAKPGRHHKDAFHLVESARYSRHFITKYERLLKKASEIWQLLQLRVLRPSEFSGCVLCVCGTRPTMTEVVPSFALGRAVVLLERTLRMLSPVVIE